MHKKALLGSLIVALIGCVPEAPQKRDNRAYELTKEEVAYFAGCLDMANKMKVKSAVIVCADLNVEFIKRHRKEWED